MSLDNLVRIGRLTAHVANAAETQRLLAAAQRNLVDADVPGISDETRFDVGYKAIMQCALAALMAAGYRPPTSVPGHHQTLVQSLSLTLELSADELLVLDALRRKRNVNDYHGDPIDPGSVRECIARGRELLVRTRAWVDERYPHLAMR